MSLFLHHPCSFLCQSFNNWRVQSAFNVLINVCAGGRDERTRQRGNQSFVSRRTTTRRSGDRHSRWHLDHLHPASRSRQGHVRWPWRYDCIVIVNHIRQNPAVRQVALRWSDRHWLYYYDCLDILTTNYGKSNVPDTKPEFELFSFSFLLNFKLLWIFKLRMTNSPFRQRDQPSMMMMKLPILPCAEKLES